MQEDGTSVTVEVEGDVAPAVVEAAAEAAAEAAEEVVKEEAAAEKAAEEAEPAGEEPAAAEVRPALPKMEKKLARQLETDTELGGVADGPSSFAARRRRGQGTSMLQRSVESPWSPGNLQRVGDHLKAG